MKYNSIRNKNEKGCETLIVFLYQENNVFFSHFHYSDTTSEYTKEYKSILFRNTNKLALMKYVLLEVNSALKKHDIQKPEELTEKIWHNFFDWHQPALEGLQ